MDSGVLTLMLLILTFVASVIGAMSGFGISTLMIPVMALVLPLQQVFLWVGVIHWLNDWWKLLLFRSGIRWHLLLSFGLPGIFTSLGGAWLSTMVDTNSVMRYLGLFLLGYTLFIMLRPAFKLSYTTTTAVLGGASSGFCSGLFGMGGAIRSAFLLPFDLKKSVFLATSGAIAVLVDAARLGIYVHAGTRLGDSLMITLACAIPVSLAGAKVGELLVNKIPQERFRFFIAACLLLLAVCFLIRSSCRSSFLFRQGFRGHGACLPYEALA